MEEEDKEIMEIIYKKLCVNVAWFIMSVLAGMLLLIIILILLMIMLDKWERERDRRKEAAKLESQINFIQGRTGKYKIVPVLTLTLVALAPSI